MKLFETNFSKEKPELIAAPVLLSTFKFQDGIKMVEEFLVGFLIHLVNGLALLESFSNGLKLQLVSLP